MVIEIGCRLVGEVVVPSPHQGCVRISVFVAVPLSGAKSRARQARPAKCGTHPLNLARGHKLCSR
jgi:hypothetical protein